MCNVNVNYVNVNVNVAKCKCKRKRNAFAQPGCVSWCVLWPTVPLCWFWKSPNVKLCECKRSAFAICGCVSWCVLFGMSNVHVHVSCFHPLSVLVLSSARPLSFVICFLSFGPFSFPDPRHLPAALCQFSVLPFMLLIKKRRTKHRDREPHTACANATRRMNGRWEDS